MQAAVGADPDQIESFRAFCSLGCQVVLVLGDGRRDLADLAPRLHAITEFQ